MLKQQPRVLLIYTTVYKITGLPAGLASINAVLRQRGYPVEIFTTTFYNVDKYVRHFEDETRMRENRYMAKKTSDNDKYIYEDKHDIIDDLKKTISGFKPDIIGISIFEPTYEISVVMTRMIKEHFNGILVVAGGVFPSLSPEIVFKEKSIDIVCVGEGEEPFTVLCDRFYAGKGFTDIPGLWVKTDKKEYKNDINYLADLNRLPFPDYQGFDDRLFYKPMQGKIYKMVNIETTRGCPYHCSYCASPMLKDSYQERTAGHYFRKMKIDKVMEQIHYQIDKHNPEFIYFSSETFLSMNRKEFAAFVDGYRRIGLPFWFQTRFETISRDKLQQLKEIGLFWLTIGVEHGNEGFRRKILNRHYKNETAVAGINILNELELGATLNNMVGFPFETRDLIFDTIKLNRQLYQINQKLETNLYLFAPFRGCKLYRLARENNLIDAADYISSTDLSDETVLKFSPEFKLMLKGLIRTFNLYVRLPEKYYPQIEEAEKFTPAGNDKFKKLMAILSSGKK